MCLVAPGAGMAAGRSPGEGVPSHVHQAAVAWSGWCCGSLRRARAPPQQVTHLPRPTPPRSEGACLTVLGQSYGPGLATVPPA